MTDIQVQKTQSTPAASKAPVVWDPSRWFRSWLSWDPFREMPLGMLGEGTETFNPSFDIKETPEGYVFKADVPGVQEKDIHVAVTNGNRLTISGKRESEKTEQHDRYYTCERQVGSFARSFTLPEGIEADKTNATLKSGVLTVMAPKKAGATKKIAVST